jgi:antitoxin FitA
MATLTIRDLDESLKRSLRVRAAEQNRSMEEEARQILRAALTVTAAPASDLATRIRSRFADFGDVQLPLAEREPVRTPPSFDAHAKSTTQPSSKRRKPHARSK